MSILQQLMFVFQHNGATHNDYHWFTLRITGKQLDYYSHVGHPYMHSYGIGENFTWVLTMSPLMSELLSVPDCIEVDITYQSAVELQYLFNVVSFNYHTMRCKLILYSCYVL